MSPARDLALRHLAKVVESSDDAIVSKDLNGTIMSWNRAAERMFGYTADEAIGQSIRMIIPADRQGEEDEVLARSAPASAVTHFETIRQRKDGTLIRISLTVSPIYDDAGGSSARRRSRATSATAEAADLAIRRLAAVVESSDDAIVTKKLDSIITSWNPGRRAACSATPRRKRIGRSIRMLIPDDLQSEEDTVLAKIRAGETRRSLRDDPPAQGRHAAVRSR